MTKKQQLRKLLDGYVVDRTTLKSIAVPKAATLKQMLTIASRHDLGVSLGGRVELQDDCYTYAVVRGEVSVIAG